MSSGAVAAVLESAKTSPRVLSGGPGSLRAGGGCPKCPLTGDTRTLVRSGPAAGGPGHPRELPPTSRSSQARAAGSPGSQGAATQGPVPGGVPETACRPPPRTPGARTWTLRLPAVLLSSDASPRRTRVNRPLEGDGSPSRQSPVGAWGLKPGSHHTCGALTPRLQATGTPRDTGPVPRSDRL